MNQISIDGIPYDPDTLSDVAKQQLINLQVTDSEIARLQTQLGIANTARATYANALNAALAEAAAQ